MKRWQLTDMFTTGQKLFTSIHRKKHSANHNHDIHFLAREINGWLRDGVQSLANAKIAARLWDDKNYRRMLGEQTLASSMAAV